MEPVQSSQKNGFWLSSTRNSCLHNVLGNYVDFMCGYDAKIGMSPDSHVMYELERRVEILVASDAAQR